VDVHFLASCCDAFSVSGGDRGLKPMARVIQLLCDEERVL
jgi:hypothetical protein